MLAGRHRTIVEVLRRVWPYEYSDDGRQLEPLHSGRYGTRVDRTTTEQVLKSARETNRRRELLGTKPSDTSEYINDGKYDVRSSGYAECPGDAFPVVLQLQMLSDD